MSNKGPTLLVDVGSANVGVGVAEKRGEGVLLSYVERITLQNISGKNTAAISSLAMEALKTALERMGTPASAPRSAHVFLAAPWYNASIRSIHFHSEKALRISHGTVEKAVADYRKNHRVAPSPSVKEMESAVSRIVVNGYPTKIARTLHGASLGIDLFESEADASLEENIRSLCRGAFPGIQISFHSFPFAAFTVLRSIRPEESFIFIDAGGEITDVAVVHRESLRFLGSFPVGALSIARLVAGAGSMADAASRLSLFAKGELSPEETLRFKEIFERAMLSWKEQYRGVLDAAQSEGPVPNTTFVVADPDELLWFSRALSSAEGLFPVHPILLTPDFFQNMAALGQDGRYDAFLTLEALYALLLHS